MIEELRGTDITGLVTRALHEWLSEAGITAAALSGMVGQFKEGIVCARCEELTRQWSVLSDDPLIAVCAPYCAEGPVDAHGAQLEVGDQVILYPSVHARKGVVTGTIISFMVDGNWTSLATINVPGARRPYIHATRKLRRLDAP